MSKILRTLTLATTLCLTNPVMATYLEAATLSTSLRVVENDLVKMGLQQCSKLYGGEPLNYKNEQHHIRTLDCNSIIDGLKEITTKDYWKKLSKDKVALKIKFTEFLDKC